MAIANLPMYDWPEIHAAMDNFWQTVVFTAKKYGITAPPTLTRVDNIQRQWLQQDLWLGQSCGLPFVNQLEAQVELFGSACYQLDDVAAGEYCSVLVAPKSLAANFWESNESRRFIANDPQSLSGFVAGLAFVMQKLPARQLSQILFSGSHRRSIQQVAAGYADFASIDAISWALALRHEPACASLQVIAVTPHLPGLPLFSARQYAALPLGDIIDQAIQATDSQTLDHLLLTGFKPRTAADYQCIIPLRDQVNEWLSPVHSALLK